MNTIDQMKEEIRAALADGEDLESVKDRSGEIADSYCPIYNNQIIEEWQAMPGEYDDRGVQEIGGDDSVGIIGRMSLDLYLYYTDLFFRAVGAIENELEESDI